MQTHSKAETRILGLSTLSPEKPKTRAGRFIASKYSIHPAQADLVAQLAGLGGER